MSNATKDAPKAEKDTKVSAKDTPDLGLLEEDDDFEEFPTEEPLAKKVCTRVSPMQEDPPPRTPPSSRRSNGHASTTPPNTNTPTSAEQQQPAQRNGRSSSRSGNAPLRVPHAPAHDSGHRANKEHQEEGREGNMGRAWVRGQPTERRTPEALTRISNPPKTELANQGVTMDH
eukprot:TCALIF_03271-PA protein Name:"Protein of unknown function" AED:0.13 eAED:0.64 QI:111/0/0.25/1/0.33/0/4/0/172